MRIAVLDDYGAIAYGLADWRIIEDRVSLRFFSKHIADTDALVAALEPYDALVLTRERTALPKGIIERLPRLKLIVSTGMANTAIDMSAATTAGIQVCGTTTMGYPTAELTWGLILGFERRIPWAQRELAAGNWLPMLGESLRGKTLGLLGLGRVGAEVARVGTAFGIQVVAWSQNLTKAHAATHEVRAVSREVLFKTADILSIHVGLDRYRNSISDAEFNLMKPTSLLVNTSRAGIVDENALLNALRTGRIRGAAIDVYQSEPPAADHPLLHHDNVLATPHLGYVVRENMAECYRQAVECIEAYTRDRVLRPLNQLH